MHIDEQLSKNIEYINTCEKAVLSHFFTSITDDVYAVTDAMPMSLWGFVAGLASRTHLSVRDRFLQVLRDTLGDEEAYCLFVCDAAEMLAKKSDVDLTPVLEKASKFLKTWAVNYGHASLKDSCVDRIVVDRCSIRAAKILEESPMGAFQEKSTRYVDFSQAKEIIPVIDVSLEAEAAQIIAESNDIYNDMLAMCEDFYKRQLDPADFANEAALVRTARAKAFDTARYCLLTSKPTALAFTMPSRETERHLASLLAHPNQEIQESARKALEAAMKINPGLLTHVESNDAQHAYPDYSDLVPGPTFVTPDTKAIWYGQYVGYPAYIPGQSLGENTRSEVLYSGPDDLLNMLASACLAEAKTQFRSYSDLMTALSQDEKPDRALEIVTRRLSTRKKHDELPKEFSIGQLAFNCLLDYGAYRDIQRHRKGLMLCSALDTAYGFSIPGVLYEPEFVDMLERYRNYMVRVGEFHQRVRATNPEASEYFFALGHNVLFTYICDFKQFIYVVELRSKAQGHMAYRKLVVAWFDAVMSSKAFKALSPEQRNAFKSLFRVDRTENTDRRNEENKPVMSAQWKS